MKKGWEVSKLEDVCEVVTRGVSPKYIEDSGLCVLNQKCIRNHNIDYKFSRFHDNKLKSIKNEKIIRIGDVLVNSTGTGTLGRIAQVRETSIKAIVDSHITIVRPIKNIFYNNFFGYAMICIEEEISKRGEGCGGQTELAKDTLKKEFDIKYPKSLLEQQRISTILDDSFDAIERAKENAEKNLQNVQEIFESYLQSVFDNPGEGWENNKINEVCKIKPPKKEARERLNDDDFVSFVPMEDLGILTKDFIVKKERTLKEVSGSYTYFSEGDVLLAKITPCFENGKIGIARNLKNCIGFGSSEYFVFRSLGQVNPVYLYYFLSRNKLRQEGKKNMTGAVGHKRVPKDFIERLEIPYPKSILEQQSIVSKLDTLSIETKKLEGIYQTKLTDLEELKQSILQKAFNGEL